MPATVAATAAATMDPDTVAEAGTERDLAPAEATEWDPDTAEAEATERDLVTAEAAPTERDPGTAEAMEQVPDTVEAEATERDLATVEATATSFQTMNKEPPRATTSYIDSVFISAILVGHAVCTLTLSLRYLCASCYLIK